MNKKIRTIAIAIALVVIVGCVIAVKLSPPGFHDVIVAKGRNTIKTNLGDEFLVEYETTKFPDYETSVMIRDMSKQSYLSSYIKKYGFEKPNYFVLVDLPNLRCYEVEDSLIYKVNGGQFKGVSVVSIESEKVEGNTELIAVSKVLFEKKEWRWVRDCGRYLLRAGDENAKETLERYALGQFTKEEDELNKTSTLKKEDIQIFAKQVLEQR